MRDAHPAWGARKIVHCLKRENQSSPTFSTVHEILRRDLYRGVVVWGRLRKRDQWGTKRWRARPESEWITKEHPELRIVCDELWEAAHARLRTARAAYLRSVGEHPHGRPPTLSSASKYLLTGLAECAACGGGMIVRSHDYRPRRYAYRCGYHHQRGRTVCTNSLEAPMEVANRAVLDTIEHHFLRSEVTEAAVATALEALLPADDTAEQERAALLMDRA